jgi:hypothetical protein
MNGTKQAEIKIKFVIKSTETAAHNELFDFSLSSLYYSSIT